jgi:hypothetical protein
MTRPPVTSEPQPTSPRSSTTSCGRSRRRITVERAGPMLDAMALVQEAHCGTSASSGSAAGALLRRRGHVPCPSQPRPRPELAQAGRRAADRTPRRPGGPYLRPRSRRLRCWGGGGHRAGSSDGCAGTGPRESDAGRPARSPPVESEAGDSRGTPGRPRHDRAGGSEPRIPPARTSRVRVTDRAQRPLFGRTTSALRPPVRPGCPAGLSPGCGLAAAGI